MKRLTFFIFISFLLINIVVTAQDINYRELARRITTDNVQITPGDVVVVQGGKHTIPLMEAIAIEAQNRGGLVEMFLYSDKVSHARMHDMPEAFFELDFSHMIKWFNEVDVFISLPVWEDAEAIFKDVPIEKRSKTALANQAILDAYGKLPMRAVAVTYPNEHTAKLYELDFDTYAQMQWAAVNADYRNIAAQARQLEKLLTNGKEVRITSPAGTDLAFKLDQRPCFMNDGVIDDTDAKSELLLQRSVNLPGGNIVVTMDESSANGKFVLPKTRCNFVTMTNASGEFKNGKLMKISGEDYKSCVTEMMNLHEGSAGQLAAFQIGLNPALRAIEGTANYRPADAAGMVTIYIGDNTFYGGKNKVSGNFSYAMAITNATVTIDGQVVVEKGKIKL